MLEVPNVQRHLAKEAKHIRHESRSTATILTLCSVNVLSVVVFSVVLCVVLSALVLVYIPLEVRSEGPHHKSPSNDYYLLLSSMRPSFVDGKMRINS